MQQKWNFYTTNEIKPSGWFKRQLKIQADGLSGHLDQIWPDIRDSAWIGGSSEGWERVPYWLDGFIPLAYLLEDEDMIARGKKYIDAILSRQRPSGWICPCEEGKEAEYDTWPVLLISKVLLLYYNCSKDERIPSALYRLLKNYHELLSGGGIHLFNWAKYRWFEGFEAIHFLMERYKEDWLTDLARLLRRQGQDYAEKIERWKRPLYKWTYDTHVVNLAMMLKSEAISHQILEAEYTDQAERFWETLTRYNGTAAGIFTGDECLAGLSPIQGTELCAVVELMYSFELLYAYTGDPKWAERLETLSFNALPATISDDMWTHQYDQMSNQISCEKFPGRPIFGTNSAESHLFGLEPNYGCCTANFSQGWPKLMLSSFLYRGNTVHSAVPIPGTLHANGINITLESSYPFENTFSYHIRPGKAFLLQVRIPSFARNLTVDGKPIDCQNCLEFAIEEGRDYDIQIAYTVTPYFMERPNGLKTVKCGSLVFALPISYRTEAKEYVRDGVERKYPYCDYEYIGTSKWQYGYCGDELERHFHNIGEIPFSSSQPPVTVYAKVQEIEWGLETGFETVCAKTPASRTPLSPKERVELYPYGCAKLRMTEMPLLSDE